MIRKIKDFLLRLTNRRPVVYCSITKLSENEVLKGRCALVTGGTSGIGFSISKAFLDAGASVIITGRNIDRINAAIQKLGYAGRVFGCELNNTNVAEFEVKFSSLLEEIKERGIHSIDILVNNAGVNYKGMPNATEDEYDKVMDTNLKGPFFLSQIFGKYLVRNHISGNILNISSASSLRPADSAYTLSKWGLRSLTMGLAKALAPYGITVNGIAPGPTATPMMIKDGNSDLKLDRIPLGRYILPEEIANMAVFLVSAMGRSIMGDTIYMTGGAGLLTYDDVNYSF